MTLPWQIAQKMHACTDPVGEPRTNDRAHDLVDLQLLEALMGEEPLGEARSACAAVFAARGKTRLSATVVAHPHWGPIYARTGKGWMSGRARRPPGCRAGAVVHRSDRRLRVQVARPLVACNRRDIYAIQLGSALPGQSMLPGQAELV